MNSVLYKCVPNLLFVFNSINQLEVNLELYLKLECPRKQEKSTWAVGRALGSSGLSRLEMFQTLSFLFPTFTNSYLEYCRLLWSPYMKQNLKKLDALQRSTTKNINGISGFNYGFLPNLKLCSLQHYRGSFIICMMYKVFRQIAQMTSVSLLKFNQSMVFMSYVFCGNHALGTSQH